MKRITIIFMLIGLVAFMANSQDNTYPAAIVGPLPLAYTTHAPAGVLDCPDSSIFSQPPQTVEFTFLLSDNRPNVAMIAYENFNLTQTDIKAITFWGTNLSYVSPSFGYVPCDTEDPMTFNVKFYQNPGGDVIGPVIANFTAVLSRIPTGFFVQAPNNQGGFPAQIYRYELEFPYSLNLDGDYWMSIRGVGATIECQFYWDASFGAGDGCLQYNEELGVWYDYSFDMSFCLVKGRKAKDFEVPLSDWAIILGVVLIGSAIWFRRMRITA